MQAATVCRGLCLFVAMAAVQLRAEPQETLTAAGAVNSFGLKLVNDLVQDQRHENIFVSPLSVFIALAMTENGAAGQTRAVMRQTLAISPALSEGSLQQSASALLKSLRSATGVQLLIANALWSEAKQPLSHQFIEQCRHVYGAKATTLHLSQPTAVDTINAWVKQNTQGKIPTIVTADDLRNALAVLTNAVYFKGTWEIPFPKDLTTDGDFHLVDGQRIKVPFMHQSAIPGAYRMGKDFEAAALPYRSSEMVFYAVLPGQGKSPEEVLAGIDLKELLSPVKRDELNLQLPKLTLDYRILLKGPLGRMGMAIAFGRNADFTPMGSDRFKIEEVVHKTRLEVDEEGTVAAAATAVMVPKSIPRQQERKSLVFDRPFALLLCDTQTGAILFAGVIYDPR